MRRIVLRVIPSLVCRAVQAIRERRVPIVITAAIGSGTAVIVRKIVHQVLLPVVKIAVLRLVSQTEHGALA